MSAVRVGWRKAIAEPVKNAVTHIIQSCSTSKVVSRASARRLNIATVWQIVSRRRLSHPLGGHA